MSYEMVSRVFTYSALDDTALLLAVAIAETADEMGLSLASEEQLAMMIRRTKRTTRRLITALHAAAGNDDPHAAPLIVTPCDHTACAGRSTRHRRHIWLNYMPGEPAREPRRPRVLQAEPAKHPKTTTTKHAAERRRKA